MADDMSFSDFLKSHLSQQVGDRVNLILSSMDSDALTKGYRGDLTFHPDSAKRIADGFVAMRMARYEAPRKWLERDAARFVDSVQSIARSMPLFERYDPETQRTRREHLESAAKHLNALADLMEKLDSSSLGWLLAQYMIRHENSREAENDPAMAQAVALHIRKFLREIIPDLGLAAMDASKSLPLQNRPDSRLRAGLILNRMFYNNGILPAFTSDRNSFGWLCMSELLILMGEDDTDKTAYWLKKTIEDPESTSAWIEDCRRRYQESQ